MPNVLSQPWWFLTWHSIVIIVAAFNAGMLCSHFLVMPAHHTQTNNLSTIGASALQGILTMPLLMLEDIPVHLAGKQVTFLLHASEIVFPPLNALCTLSYITLTIIAYTCFNSSSSIFAAPPTNVYANYPALALAAASHILPTVFTLSVMAKMNKKMVMLSKQMNEAVSQSKEKTHEQMQLEEEFRKTQKTWQFWSYVRGVIMTGCAIAGMRALLY